MVSIDKPHISVILPTYNRAHLIHRAISSILQQTYTDFEVIVIDDGSTDNTQDVVKSFSDPRITYIKNPQNQGTSVARNRGIQSAQGDYIAFLDSDDEWFPSKLQKQIELFHNAPANLGVVYCRISRLENNKEISIPEKHITPKQGKITKVLLKKNFIPIVSAVVKKECFQKLGMFDEAITYLEDWEMWIRFSTYYDFKYLDETLVKAYFTVDSMTAKKKNQNKILRTILTRYQQDFEKCTKTLAWHYFNLGHRICLSGDFQEGKQYLLQSVRTYPFQMKSSIALLISFFGTRIYSALYNMYQKCKISHALF